MVNIMVIEHIRLIYIQIAHFINPILLLVINLLS